MAVLWDGIRVTEQRCPNPSCVSVWHTDPQESTTNPTERALVACYECDGAEAVIQWVEVNHHDWSWGTCAECDSRVPVWNDRMEKCCAVCFSTVL